MTNTLENAINLRYTRDVREFGAVGASIVPVYSDGTNWRIG